MPEDEHREAALTVLADLARTSKNERIRLAAALELARSTRPKLAAKPRRKLNPWEANAARLAAEAEE